MALSRAKDGLYILGNAAQLSSKSRMWRGVIQELEQVGGIGNGFPIACHRHPYTIEYISEPGWLPRFAPDGKTPWFRPSKELTSVNQEDVYNLAMLA